MHSLTLHFAVGPGDRIRRTATVGGPLDNGRRYELDDVASTVKDVLDRGRRLWQALDGARRSRADEKSLVAPGRALADLLLPPPRFARLLDETASLLIDADEPLSALPFELIVRGDRFLCLQVAMGRQIAPARRECQRRVERRVTVIGGRETAADLVDQFVRRLEQPAWPAFCSAPVPIVSNVEGLRAALAEAAVPVIIAHRAGQRGPERDRDREMLQDATLAAEDLRQAYRGDHPVPGLLVALACGDPDHVGDYARAAGEAGIRHVVSPALEITTEYASRVLVPLFDGLGGELTIGEAVRRAREALWDDPDGRILALSLMLHGAPDQAYVFNGEPFDPDTSVVECDHVDSDGGGSRCSRVVPITHPLAAQRRCPRHAHEPSAAGGHFALEGSSVTPAGAFMRVVHADDPPASRGEFPLYANDAGGRRWEVSASVRLKASCPLTANAAQGTRHADLDVGLTVRDPHAVVNALAPLAGHDGVVLARDAAQQLLDLVAPRLNELVDEYERHPDAVDPRTFANEYAAERVNIAVGSLGLAVATATLRVRHRGAPIPAQRGGGGGGGIPRAVAADDLLAGFVKTAPAPVAAFLQRLERRAASANSITLAGSDRREAVLRAGEEPKFVIQTNSGRDEMLVLLFEPGRAARVLAPQAVGCPLFQGASTFPVDFPIESEHLPRLAEPADAERSVAVVAVIASSSPALYNNRDEIDAELLGRVLEDLDELESRDGQRRWLAGVAPFRVVSGRTT